MTRQEVITILERMIRDENTIDYDRIQAIAELAKIQGFYAPNQFITKLQPCLELMNLN